jgi:hypothetical protein
MQERTDVLDQWSLRGGAETRVQVDKPVESWWGATRVTVRWAEGLVTMHLVCKAPALSRSSPGQAARPSSILKGIESGMTGPLISSDKMTAHGGVGRCGNLESTLP